MEAQPLPPKLRMQEFRRYLYDAVPESAKSPRDLLNDNVRAELIGRANMDGVSHYLSSQSKTKRGIPRCRPDSHPIERRGSIFSPADLEHLGTLVSRTWYVFI
jgi:hypothetical protein